jgi:Na+/glutamate symporter
VTLRLTETWTLILALLAIGLGRIINHRLPWLERGNIPPSVTAGLPLSLAFAALRAGGVLDLTWDRSSATSCCWCSLPPWGWGRISPGCSPQAGGWW